MRHPDCKLCDLESEDSVAADILYDDFVVAVIDTGEGNYLTVVFQDHVDHKNFDPNMSYYMTRIAIGIGNVVFGKENFLIDTSQADFPGHIHWHLRPKT